MAYFIKTTASKESLLDVLRGRVMSNEITDHGSHRVIRKSGLALVVLIESALKENGIGFEREMKSNNEVQNNLKRR